MNRRRSDRAASPPTREPAPWLLAFLIAAAATLIYINSLSLPFFFDDHSAIVENEGLTLTRRGRHLEAIDSFNAAIALEPRTASLHMNLASSLAEIGRFDEAIEQCRRALPLEPDPAARADIEGLIALLASDKEKGRAVRPAPPL